jgi:regulator of sigma E protease
MTELIAGGFSALSYILPFLAVLTVIVFIHEMGHFLVARWCGVAVETFSIGFGRELIGWNDKKGTRWKISLWPLGGYVKFLGDHGPTSTPDREALEEMSAKAGVDAENCFHFKPLWQRSAVVAAGPIANFLLAIGIYTGLLIFIGESMILPVVGSVEENSAAEAAGFQPNDRIIAVDSRKVDRFSELAAFISMSSNTERTITVLRGDEEVELLVTPRREESEDAFGNKQQVGRLGITARFAEEDRVFEKHSLPSALWRGTQKTGFVLERSLAYIGRIVTGKEDTKQLGGPLKIGQYSGQAWQFGEVWQSKMLNIIQMIAVLSISIGMINLFPIPMLDGGHLLFYGFEAIKGQPLSERTQEFGFRIGLSLVLMLMLYVTWNDLNNFNAFERITGLFS